MQRSFNYGCDRQSELKALRANKTLISNQYSERQLKEVHYEHTVANVLDRLIQQAIAQVLTPIFDPKFSESSFGFRPGRSAHGAAKRVQQIIRQQHAHCIDVDLSKFFDQSC
jgi:retron-type reverse transcriptase